MHTPLFEGWRCIVLFCEAIIGDNRMTIWCWAGEKVEVVRLYIWEKDMMLGQYKSCSVVLQVVSNQGWLVA